MIPASGQEARSEALEHLLEHIIMRKQEQIDFLHRVRRGSEGSGLGSTVVEDLQQPFGGDASPRLGQDLP